jgi:hypothetical protein
LRESFRGVGPLIYGPTLLDQEGWLAMIVVYLVLALVLVCACVLLLRRARSRG